MIKVLITPTMRCDRGCSICEFDSNMSGESISPSLISSLPRDFSRLGPGEKHFCITGGGEPLLYPWTPNLMWGVLEDRRNYLDLVTSGCTGELDTGYKCLKLITDVFRSSRLRVYLSYNAFMPKADERLRFTLPLVRKINGLVCIKVAMSYLDRSPIERLNSLLVEMGYGKNLALVEERLPKKSFDRICDSEYLGELADFSHLVYFRDYDYSEMDIEEGFRGYSRQIVSIQAQTLLIDGRADKLAPTIEELYKHTTPRKRCRYLRNPSSRFLRIDHTGAIYPCCVETPNPSPLLQIGRLGEITLWEAMAKRENILAEARVRTLKSRTAFNSNPCGYCSDNRTGA